MNYHDAMHQMVQALESGALNSAVDTPAKLLSPRQPAYVAAKAVSAVWMNEALALISDCCRHRDPAIRLPAYAIVARIGTAHAQIHAAESIPVGEAQDSDFGAFQEASEVTR
jgi:hypothetical protein